MARIRVLGAIALAAATLAVGSPCAHARGGDREAPPASPASPKDPLAERRVASASPEGRFLAEAGSWLLDEMREDAAPAKAGGVHGAWWREFDAHPFTTDDLYGGVAGTVLSLMTLAEATGDARYAYAARRGVRHLIDAAVETPEGLAWDVAWDDREEKVHHSRRNGLYTGAAGIAWVLLSYGDALDDAEALRAGVRGLDGVIARGTVEGEPSAPRRSWDDGALDVISGSAGIVEALLDGWRVTGEERFRRAAVEGAEGLLAAARREGDAWSWPPGAGAERVYSGASHGVAGVGIALARVHLATGDPRFLEAAEGAARWLERPPVCVHEGDGVAWLHDSTSKPDERPWLGWCHGPAGTARLHLLLHGITGDARYLEVAEAGARFLVAHTDATKDRAGSGFYAPSLCCGAAGIGMYLLDLHRHTGDARWLDAAAAIVGFLDRVADRPKAGQLCVSLSGRPESKDGAKCHGTCLMVGQGGYVTFWARLAQERQRVVREVFLPPDLAAPGAPPGRREVVVELGPRAERFRRVARRLASFRGAERERLASLDRPDALRDLVRRTRADALAIVLAPETLDGNLNRRVLDAVCRVDDDVFPDASYGYLTARDPEHALAMLDRMGEVEADGLAPRGVSFGTVSAGFADVAVVAPRDAEDGVSWTHVYVPLVEQMPTVRRAIGKALGNAAGAGVVEFGGNGDAMRVWLFSDARNAQRAKWWPYDPARVLRDFAHAEMPGIGAPDLQAFDVAGRVVWFSTCHSGEPTRTIAGGDVVSTFGDTGRRVRVHPLAPDESLCLAILDRAPAAFLAPVGPNHGWQALVERRRAVRERLALGEAIRRGQVEVALADGPAAGIPLVEQRDGELETRPAGAGAIMRENVLNRVLFGDPAFEPFSSLGGVGAPLLAVETTASGAGLVDAHVRVEVADPLAWWGSLYGPDRPEVLVAAVPLRGDARGISSVASVAAPGVVSAEWAIESRRGRTPLLWLVLHASRGADPNARSLWVAGKDFRFRATLAAGADAPVAGGDVRLAR